MRRFPFLTLILLAPPAAADDLFEDRPARTPTIGEVRPLERLYQPAETPPAATPATPASPFGTKGTSWWTFGTGIAYNFAEATDANLHIAYSTFLAKDLELSGELAAWYFNQPGEDALGINPVAVFRWHFYNKEDWTIFADAGIGLLFCTDEVPDGGTSFDFTPRVGAGFTHRIADDGTRLQVGLRWHHISNARIEGDSGNPARDGIMLYAGVMVPF